LENNPVLSPEGGNNPVSLPPTAHVKILEAFSLPVALASILVFWVLLAAGQDVRDPDVWWHMRNARYLFTHWQLPRVDMYSFTVTGHPWIDHEWLAEIPYYLAWRAFGWVGVYALFVCLVEIMMLGVFYLAAKQSGNVKGAFWASCYSVFLAVVTFAPRTILFGYIYLLILLILLDRFRSRGQAPLWILPPLFCLWINSHGSWLLGIIVFAILVAAGLWEGNWGRVEAVRWSAKQLRQLLATGLASLGALFVNPYGYHLVLYPFDLGFRQKLMTANVEEWAPLDLGSVRGKIVLLLLLALFLFLLWGRYNWKLNEVVLASFALYAGLTHTRFLCLIGIILTPIVAKCLSIFPPYRRENDKPLLNAVIALGLLAATISRFPSRTILEEDLGKEFPAAALTFIRSHDFQGRTFNLYSWGGFLGWNEPNLKVFIDSRGDIFEYTGVMKDYLDAIRIKDTLGVFDKYQIRYVIMPPDAAVCYFLKHNQDWQVVLSDKVVTIFQRVGPLSGTAQVKPLTVGELGSQ